VCLDTTLSFVFPVPSPPPGQSPANVSHEQPDVKHLRICGSKRATTHFYHRSRNTATGSAHDDAPMKVYFKNGQHWIWPKDPSLFTPALWPHWASAVLYTTRASWIPQLSQCDPKRCLQAKLPSALPVIPVQEASQSSAYRLL
jgi:hypothetical protein